LTALIAGEALKVDTGNSHNRLRTINPSEAFQSESNLKEEIIDDNSLSNIKNSPMKL